MSVRGIHSSLTHCRLLPPPALLSAPEMSFRAGGLGVRRGRDPSPALEETQQPEAESDSVEEGDDDAEEEEEEAEEGDEEEGGEGEEEEDEASEAEEVEDDDRTPDEEDQDDQDRSYDETGEEERREGGDDGDRDEGNESLDQGGAADESFVDYDEGGDEEGGEEEEEEEEAPFPSPTPFTFSAGAPSSSSSASSAFPSFSMGSGGGSFPSSSLPPFSFSASTSSSSSPFTFPSSTTFNVGANATSSTTTSVPFVFSSTASAPTPAPASASAAAFSSASVAPFAFSSTTSSATSNSLQSTSTSSFPTSFTSAFASTSTAPSISSSAPSSSLSTSVPAPTPSTSGASGGVIAVPVTCRGVSAVWGGGGELFLYPNAESNKSTSHVRNHQPVPFHGSDVFRFQWPTPYGEMTTLLHSWHAVFLHVQQQARVQAAKGQGKAAVQRGTTAVLSPIEWREFLLTQSHCYRAELDACLYRAAQSLSSVSTRQELARHRVSSDEYHAHLLLLETAASTWHLFELVCLDPHDNLTVQLVDWLQRSTAAPHTQGLQMDSDEWWTALLHLLVQGRLTAVMEMLTEAMTSSSSPFSFLPTSAITQLLEVVQSLPSLTAHATSVHHLVSMVRDYQLAVQHLAASTSAFQSHPYLPVLLSILAGDEAALTAVCEDWMQLLVAHLIFVQPQTSKQDLPDLVQRCVEGMEEKEREEGGSGRSAVPLLAQLRQHVLCFRVHSAVLLADQLFELPVFTAHLVDLLHLAGVMPTLRQAEKPQGRKSGQQQAAANGGVGLGEMTPRAWYVWQFILSIQHHDRLWTLTLDYINTIGTSSASSFSSVHALCALLLSQRCDSSTQLLQLLALCSTHQLPAFVSERLCERFAQTMLREGQTGSAVYWYERAGDSGKRRIRQIATRLLDRLIVEGGADRNDEMEDGDHDRALSRQPIEEAEAAMEALLDNVSEQWLHEESGCVEVILLQQWRDFTASRRQLREAHYPQSNGRREAAAPLNIFQDHQRPTSHAGDAMQDDGVDGLTGADDPRLALTQSCVALLISLLTEPLVHPSHGALLYSPQSLHLPLLRELSGLLQSLDAQSVSGIAECSVGGLQGVLNALNRCELSWRWSEWKKRARLGVQQVQEVRTVLLHCMQSALLMEESAKRLNVRV